MAAKGCHTVALLFGAVVSLVAASAMADTGAAYPARVEHALEGLADEATGPVTPRFCPRPGLLVVRLSPADGVPLDVEVTVGADPSAFRSAGAFALAPVLNAEWSEVPAAQVRAFDSLAESLSTRGGQLARAVTAAPGLVPEAPGLLPELSATPLPPSELPWIPLVGFALVLVAGARARDPRLPSAAELLVLFGVALALRCALGLWGPLHVNGLGPLWLLGAWGRPELVQSYGPGYPEWFTAIARAFPGAPDMAVFGANAVLSALVAPAAAWLAAGLGHGRGAALLAGVLLACDPVTVLGGASESYYPAIFVSVMVAAGAVAHATSVERWRGPTLVLGAALLLLQAARIHPLAWPLVAIVPLVAVVAIRPSRALLVALGTWALFGAGVALAWDGLLPVVDHLQAQGASGAMSSGNFVLPGPGFWIAAVFALAAAGTLGRQAVVLLLVCVAFVGLDAATHRVFGQSDLWQASYRHVVLAIPVVCALGLLPEGWLRGGRRQALATTGLAAIVLLSGAGLFPQRTTEQLEYRWLRGALEELPAECRVAWVDRAERRVMTLPEHLVPGWACGTTSGVSVRTPGDVSAGLMPGACRTYYRSSLCSSPEGAPLCAAAEAGVGLEELDRAELAPVPSYRGMGYTSDPVVVTLFRVTAPAP